MAAAVPVTLGATRARAVDVAGGSATSVFPANVDLRRHEHGRTTVAIILRGGFLEIRGFRPRLCPPATVLIGPAGERRRRPMG